MNILLLTNYNTPARAKNRKIINFAGNNKCDSNANIVHDTVNNYFSLNHDAFVRTTAKNAFEEFAAKTKTELQNSSKACDAETKIKILDSIANAYRNSESRINPYDKSPKGYTFYQLDKTNPQFCHCFYYDTEKAGILTALKMREIYNNPAFSDAKKHNLIISEENMSSLLDFFKGKNREGSWDYVMNTLSDIGYEEFLPYAELICYNSVHPDNNDILYQKSNYYNNSNSQYVKSARKLINKHYDLNKLKSFRNIDTYYQLGAIATIREWGLPEHIDLLESYLESNDPKVVAEAIKSIGIIGNRQNIKMISGFLNSCNPKIIEETIVAIANLGEERDFNLIKRYCS